MLTLLLPAIEDIEAAELQFEHSLVSLSKWESKHKKPFYSKDLKTEDEALDYIANMLLTPNPPEHWTDRLSQEDYRTIQDYINDIQSATTVHELTNQPPSREIVTSELIYYWMISFNIPFIPCEEWNLNRLMMLIKVAGIKSAPPKKMSKEAQAAEFRRMNEKRRQELGTTG